jgi:hypothetical protein
VYRPVVKITSQNLADDIASAGIIVKNELYNAPTGRSLQASNLLAARFEYNGAV